MFRVKASAKLIDRGWKEILKSAKALKKNGAFVKVGILGEGDKRSDGEIGNVELGMIHEFGAPAANIPERSFIRSTFDTHRPEYVALLKQLVPAFLDGGATAREVLDPVGAKMASDVKRHITEGDGIPPPNTPEVFMRKLRKNERGFDRTGDAPRTLVDTGQLLSAITWEVVEGEKKGHSHG